MFLNESNFQLMIEELVQTRRLSHLDAMVTYCEENHIDPEDLVSVISTNLKDKIRMDAMESGAMRQTSVLPI